MTEREIIEAIRANHLKANIRNTCYVRHYWDEAWLDTGPGLFAKGPYVKLPVDWLVREGSDETERVVIRVYPPERLRRKLADAVARTGGGVTGGPRASRT